MTRVHSQKKIMAGPKAFLIILAALIADCSDTSKSSRSTSSDGTESIRENSGVQSPNKQAQPDLDDYVLAEQASDLALSLLNSEISSESYSELLLLLNGGVDVPSAMLQIRELREKLDIILHVALMPNATLQNLGGSDHEDFDKWLAAVISSIHNSTTHDGITAASAEFLIEQTELRIKGKLPTFRMRQKVDYKNLESSKIPGELSTQISSIVKDLIEISWDHKQKQKSYSALSLAGEGASLAYSFLGNDETPFLAEDHLGNVEVSEDKQVFYQALALPDP